MFTPKHNSGNGQEIVSPQSAGAPQTPRLNDDAAERRRRRKSAIERRRSNLVTPHRMTVKSPLFNPSPQLLSPAPFAVQLPRLTPEELNQRYEEWMKIAADNKINANNTWDFALIDYFYDMSLLRDGDSINFQKASCTLDGCVKIYSSRVDSVASETGRLLSGLAEAPGKRGSRRGDEGEEGEDGGNEDAEKQKARRAARSAATLAKDFASISLKKLDLEFSVDPLFKKTSADFDEGGARGLLLNHLSFDADGKIVFDASSSKALADSDYTENIEPNDLDGIDSEANTNGDVANDAVINSGKHRPSLIDISTIDDIFGTIVQHLDEALICPSLSDFEFTRDTSLDFSLLKENFRDDGADPAVDNQAEGNVIEDNSGFGSFGDGEDNSGIDADGDDMGHFLNFDETGSGPVPLETASTLQIIEAEEADDSGECLTGVYPQTQLAIAEDEDNLLSYFDMKLTKGWAGPEHWRLPISRAAMQKQLNQRSAEDDSGNATEDSDAKRKRVEKQVYFTDFMNGPDVSADTLFARPQRASMITMSRKATMNQDHTLPEDVHFSSKNLFNLLLKPKLKFNPRRVRVAAAGSSGSSAISTPGADSSGTNIYGGFVVEGDDAGNVFGDDGQLGDGDRIGFDAADDFDDMDDDVLRLSSTATGDGESKPDMPQLKLIKPLYVNYARRAKRVNVKKLKDNIWREMASSGRRKSSAAPGSTDTPDVMAGDDDILLSDKQKFSEVVSNLKNVYPPEKLEELSISYCFICLLHLANERNLRIEGDTSLSDLVITQDRFE
ncbi:hypothetical protein GGI25_003459 [Coemansia spiralis]|uniref:Condensin complex subunit 2 n=2 Tax=Coemansia TaxID=4863 RepID=A0A9W8G6Y9_9FUNG|nr:hypothetical protein EDC05_003399 [Coemansia umbellata]KAJ2621571.1 hypothetical protein GGI26_004034 [Coemansia sp. RSA 1358]KAJ2676707.1 hypothetical protein GGI25_003459 [Coemansia spiralis]